MKRSGPVHVICSKGNGIYVYYKISENKYLRVLVETLASYVQHNWWQA